MREPQGQADAPSRARLRPGRHGEPKLQSSAADAQRWLDHHGAARATADIPEQLRGVPFN